jgi:hypothetical protein
VKKSEQIRIQTINDPIHPSTSIGRKKSSDSLDNTRIHAKLFPNMSKLPVHADKKPKLDRDSNDDDDETIDLVWQHYRQYTDAEDDDDDDDVLQEIIDVVTEQWPSTVRNNEETTKLLVIRNRQDLLPVLISVASTVLAERKIGEWLTLDSSPKYAENGENEKEEALLHKQQHISNIQTHLVRALRSFPQNAQTWSIAINFIRIMVNHHKDENNGSDEKNHPISAPDLAEMYLHGADCAHSIREQAIQLLGAQNKGGSVSDECKEWIEMLLLNQVTGVGFQPDDDEQEKNSTEDDPHVLDEWSQSSVEGTARFMAAMQFSMANRHDDAAKQLEYFDLTHRMHPNIWKWTSSSSLLLSLAGGGDGQNNTPASTINVCTPVAFRHSAGILPDALYHRLCETFAPKAPYWTESNYTNRGYYSFFLDLPPLDETSGGFIVSNLVEDVVCNHLLPLALQQLHYQKKSETTNPAASTQIVGYEFWLHTRPMASNLGHNLHFDTDEALLSQEGLVTHPIVSSILYLTGGENSQQQGDNHGGGRGGATVIFDQNPDSERGADFAWLSPPVDNSFVVFPGNLLHGVLPCGGSKSTLQIQNSNDNKKMNGNNKITVENLIHRLQSIGLQDQDTRDASTPHRLTLLVGFWTRRVPDRMKHRKLYGPCGPLPPPDTACWVKAIQKGYNVGTFSSSSFSSRKVDIDVLPLPCISPAWEHLSPSIQMASSNNSNQRTKLQIPRALDHRYFVKDAPGCFRESLFEKDEYYEEQAETDSDE